MVIGPAKKPYNAREMITGRIALHMAMYNEYIFNAGRQSVVIRYTNQIRRIALDLGDIPIGMSPLTAGTHGITRTRIIPGTAMTVT
jgi:hypothetical protein